MQRLARYFRRHHTLKNTARLQHTFSPKSIETNSLGVPLKPSWSVNELLSSYPTPNITPSALNKLFALSALVPPEEGSVEHAKVTRDIEEMIRLVEAVKLVDTRDIVVTGRAEMEDMDRKLYQGSSGETSGETGQSLLKHASRTVDGFYVVAADRSR